MAAVTPVQYEPSSTSVQIPETSSAFPSGESFVPPVQPYETVPPTAPTIEDHLPHFVVDLHFTPTYPKFRAIGIMIGLLVCIRLALLGLLFCPWTLKSVMERGYEENYLFYGVLDLEGLIIPVEARDKKVVRAILACTFPVDFLVCLSSAFISLFVKKLSWISILFVLWVCFMLLTLAIYCLGTALFILHNRYLTLLYVHLALIPLMILLLLINVKFLRDWTKMGIVSFPKADKRADKIYDDNTRRKSKMVIWGLSKDQETPANVSTTTNPLPMGMDNESMYKNIFGEPDPAGPAGPGRSSKDSAKNVQQHNPVGPGMQDFNSGNAPYPSMSEPTNYSTTPSTTTGGTPTTQMYAAPQRLPGNNLGPNNAANTYQTPPTDTYGRPLPPNSLRYNYQNDPAGNPPPTYGYNAPFGQAQGGPLYGEYPQSTYPTGFSAGQNPPQGRIDRIFSTPGASATVAVVSTAEPPTKPEKEKEKKSKKKKEKKSKKRKKSKKKKKKKSSS